jgi:hypothetical protein
VQISATEVYRPSDYEQAMARARVIEGESRFAALPLDEATRLKRVLEAVHFDRNHCPDCEMAELEVIRLQMSRL